MRAGCCRTPPRPAHLLLLLPRLLQQRLQQRERAALPEAVAAVHQLVGAAVEAALNPALALRRPVQQAVQVQRVALARQHQRRQAAEGVTAVRLVARLATQAALVRLRWRVV